MANKKVSEFRNLPSTSILRAFPTFEDGEKERFSNCLRTYSISGEVQNNSFLFEWYIIEEEEYLDNISAKFYGTPMLWWVVADFNELVNPFEALEPGRSIKILRGDFLYVIFDDIQEIGEL